MILPLLFVGGIAVATGVATVATVLTVATLVQGVKAYKQAKSLQASLGSNIQNQGTEILANKVSAGGKIPVIYGSRRVGSQIVFMDTADNESKDLFVVYALSIGEVENIDGHSIELDGNPINDTARFKDGGYIGSDKINSGAGSLNTANNTAAIDTNVGAGNFGTDPALSYRMVFNLHHGATSQTADPMFTASISAQWTSAHKLNGIAYIAAKYHYDEEGMWSGVPQLTVNVQGKKVFDPRDNTQTFGTISTYKWSDNPALCFLDYITNNEYGKGLTSTQINMSTFSTAANTADTQVDTPNFNGSPSSLAWSGLSGNNFVSLTSFADYSKFKTGQLLQLKDDSGNVIVNNRIITDLQINNFYDTTTKYLIYFDAAHPLTQNYTVVGNVNNALGTVKRFHCNGVLDINRTVMENAQDLLANMRGIFSYINGAYELQIEDTGSSSFSITEDHIMGDAGISVDYGSKDQKANKVIVEYFNGEKKFETDTAIVLHSASPSYFSDDGDEILEIKAEFPFVTDPYIAHNMAKAILTRSRYQTQVSFLGTPEMYKLNVGDIVDLTYAGLGFSNKVFRIESLILQANALLQVNMIEYFDVYTWTIPTVVNIADTSNLPTAYAVKAPANLAFTDSSSSSTGRPFIAWTQPTDFPDNQYYVNIVNSSGVQVLSKIVAVNNVDLTYLPVASNYVATVQSMNANGIRSVGSSLTFTVSDEPVATTDLRNSVITTVKIADTAITTAKIGNAQITNAKISDLSAEKINAGSLNADRISAGSINIASKGVVGSAGNIAADSGTKNNATQGDNVVSFYFGQSTSLLTFFNSAPFRTNGTYTLYKLAEVSFTTAATKDYSIIGGSQPVGVFDGDEEIIIVIELMQTSNSSVKFETGLVKTGSSAANGFSLGGDASLAANTAHTGRLYVGQKNVTYTSTSQLGFTAGYIQIAGLSV